MFKNKETGEVKWGKITGWSVGAVIGLIVVVILIGLLAGVINRYEKREDAHNEVTVTKTLIEKAREEAKVNYAQIEATKAEAKKRVAESIGIKEAQVEINKTLTPIYVQHEYVEALEDIAHSPNSTILFVPTGESGIPNVINPIELAGR